MSTHGDDGVIAIPARQEPVKCGPVKELGLP